MTLLYNFIFTANGNPIILEHAIINQSAAVDGKLVKETEIWQQNKKRETEKVLKE